MRFRNLRIAWSVACGLAAVLLIVLWVRSYSAGTVLAIPLTSTQGVKLVSQRGFLGAVLFDPRDEPQRHDNKWGFGNYTLDGWDEPSWDIRIRPKPNIYAQAMIPWWLVALVAVPSFVATWLPWRFSLRNLLIATTLVAVVLGLAVMWLR